MTPHSDDRAAIQLLGDRYRELVDSGNVDALAELFSEDALLEARLGSWAEFRNRQPHMSLYLLGHEPLLHFFVTPDPEPNEHGSFAAREEIQDDSIAVLHVPMAHSISQTGADSAEMVCYLTYHYLADGPTLMAYGRYDDRLVRVDGTWKIAERMVAIEWDGRVDEPGVPRHSPYPWPVSEAPGRTPPAEDHSIIQELAARYCHTVDYRQWDALLDLFTTDVHWGTHLNSWAVHRSRVPDLRMALRGRDDIKNFFAGSADRDHRRPAVREGNVSKLETHSINGDGESASMVSHFTFQPADAASGMAIAHGRYEDRLTKVQGQWKFAHRYVALDCDERPVASGGPA